MKPFLTIVAMVCLSVSAFAQTGYTTVMANAVVDNSGAPLASGTATFQVTDASGHPMSVEFAATGGQVMTAPVSVAVVNGVFSARIVDVSMTSPSFPCISLNITDNATGSVVWQNGCLQPVGGVYDMDFFSTNTTPVQPQAGDTVQGNLGVNGNLSVTGNLNLGGLNIGALSTTSASITNLTATNGSITNLNGYINAALFAGSDIGAKVNAAYGSCSDAAPCHVYIPAGVYSYSTPIVMPFLNQGIQLTCDRNAALTFTGALDAIKTHVAVNGGNNGGTLIDGGCVITGTSAANSGLHIGTSAGVTVKDLTISGFTSGDGVWVDGANVVHMSGMTVTGNKINIHETGNMCNGANLCEWNRNSSGTWVFTSLTGVSGFAPNAIHVTDSRINNGSQWGAVVEDIVGGSVSAGFNNSFDHNTFEGNGVGGIGGAVLLGFSTETNIDNNYFESNDNGIVEGCIPGSPAITLAPTGYTAQFCGTAAGVRVESNFFNDPATADEVHYNFSNSPVTNYNLVSSNAQCLIDSNTYTGKMSINANVVFGSGSLTCQGGSAGGDTVAPTPGGSLAGYVESADTTTGDKHFQGNLNIDNALFLGGQLDANTNANTLTAGAVIVAKIGALNIWQSTVAPAGSCGSTPNIWFTGSEMYICSGTWRLVTHS